MKPNLFVRKAQILRELAKMEGYTALRKELEEIERQEESYKRTQESRETELKQLGEYIMKAAQRGESSISLSYDRGAPFYFNFEYWKDRLDFLNEHFSLTFVVSQREYEVRGEHFVSYTFSTSW